MSALLADLLVEIQANDPSADGTHDRPDAADRYAWRGVLIWQALAIATHEGVPAGVAFDPNDPDHPVVVYIELPGVGQVSWHMPVHVTPWDGHTHSEKTERIAAYAKGELTLAQRSRSRGYA